jgi:hypothetical protein
LTKRSAPRRSRAGAGVALAASVCGLLALVPAAASALRGADDTHTAAGIETISRTVALPAEGMLREGPPVLLDERFDSDEALPSHAVEVHRTTLNARLDPGTHVIEGSEDLLFHSPAEVEVKELSFHLYLNAFKNERSEFLRGQLGAGRGGSLPTDWGHIDVTELLLVDEGDGHGEENLLPGLAPFDPESGDQTDLRVPLPRPLAPHGTLRLRLKFRAKLPSVVERTGYLDSFHMAGQWFPKLSRLSPSGQWEHFAFHRFTEFSSDFGHYDATIDVPKGFVVGATGQRTSRTERGDRVVEHYEQGDVHDFAFAAWDKFVERESVIAGVHVRQLFPPGHEHAIAKEAESLEAAIGCYGRRFGRYPYGELTVIRPPRGADEAGGMEYPTLITTGGHWSGPPFVRLTESLVIHEFGHQHFYGLLASNEQRSPFLDEGLNTFAEDLCSEERYGFGSAVETPFLQLDSAQINRGRSAALGHDHPVAGTAPSFPTARHYGALVYGRTATLLHTLRRAYGEARFDQTLARYARAYRFRHPSRGDFLDALRQGLGAEAAENARIALEERGWVDFAAIHLDSVKERSPSGVFDRGGGQRETVAGTETGSFVGSVVVVRRGTLALPVDIRLDFEDGTSRVVHWDAKATNEPSARLPVRSASRLIHAQIDPEQRILLDERRDNDGVGDRTHHLAPRVTETAAFLIGLAAELTGP